MKTLIIVDCQLDFCVGGALAVPGADFDFLQSIYKYSKQFEYVIATQDWHPQDHCSFDIQGGKWPVHCVQGTGGARLHPVIEAVNPQLIFRKGWRRNADCYSAFFDEEDNSTGLKGLLEHLDLGITGITVCGLALDFCVLATAIDAAKYVCGAEVIVPLEYTRAINNPAGTIELLKQNGVIVI